MSFFVIRKDDFINRYYNAATASGDLLQLALRGIFDGAGSTFYDVDDVDNALNIAKSIVYALEQMKLFEMPYDVMKKHDEENERREKNESQDHT